MQGGRFLSRGRAPRSVLQHYAAWKTIPIRDPSHTLHPPRHLPSKTAGGGRGDGAGVRCKEGSCAHAAVAHGLSAPLSPGGGLLVGCTQNLLQLCFRNQHTHTCETTKVENQQSKQSIAPSSSLMSNASLEASSGSG